MGDPINPTQPSVAPEEHVSSGVLPASGNTARMALERIKEHKILQWGLAYIGAAIAIAHGQELLAEAFDWPHLIGRILMSVLVVGLPLVLALAWYHGHKGFRQVGTGETYIISLLVLIGAGLLVVLVRSPSEHASAALAAPEASSIARAEAVPGISLAVLPFVNMSPDPQQEYFSDGLSEELLNALAQIKDLKVAGRTSSFSFKGKNEDLVVIGEKLRVNHLLEGSVRKDGNQLRITAQLINATTGVHMWSKTYDRELKNVFSVQEDIAKDVAKTLSIALDVGDMSRAKGGTDNVEAYDKYLHGRDFYNRGGISDFQQSVQLYHEALALDPDFARAWVGLYRSLEQMLIFQSLNAPSITKDMAEARARIFALTPNAWWAQQVRASQATREHNWAEAVDASAAAFASAPSTENVGLSYGVILQELGRVNEGLEYIQRARQIDPLSLTVSTSLQMALDAAGRPDEAQAEYERSKDLAGDHSTTNNVALRRKMSRPDPDLAAVKTGLRDFLRASHQQSLFGLTLENIADKPAALAALHRQYNDPTRQTGNLSVLLGSMADLYGDKELALAAFRRGFIDLHGSAYLSFWPNNKTGLHSDPRFRQLVRDLKFTDYFRAAGKWNDFCHPVSQQDFVCQ